MADDAIAVLDDAGIDSAHVMGASMGGAIAQLVALRHPERVRSLVLACTACRNFQWRRELLTEWASIANERGMGEMARRAAHWVMAPRSVRRFWPVVGWFGPLAMGLPPHAFASQVRAILDAPEELIDVLATLDVPTLVVVGNQDILTPRGDSEELAERIPGAELVVISGAAHGLMIEHATTFNRVVARVPAPGSPASKPRPEPRCASSSSAPAWPGLMAARELVGGGARGRRCSTRDGRREGGWPLAASAAATLDHGAQFFTVRIRVFGAHVERWAVDRPGPRVVPWLRRGRRLSPLRRHRRDERAGQAPGRRARRALLDAGVRHPARRGHRGWSVGLDDGTAVAADAIIVTCPLPQSFSLLITAGVELPPDRCARRLRPHARAARRARRPAAVPPPGGVQDADETVQLHRRQLGQGRLAPFRP